MSQVDVHPSLGKREGLVPRKASDSTEMEKALDSPAAEELGEPSRPAATPGKDHRSAYIFARLRKDLPPPSENQIKLMVGGLMITMTLLGWQDGAFGPLIPFLQNYYHKSHLLISMVYVANFGGNVISGATNVYLTDRLGFGIVIVLGALFQTIGYACMGSGGPFPLFVVAQILMGWGFGLQDSQTNALVTRLPNASRNMFLVQACFGLGATISPFVSTPFAAHVRRAYLYYFTSMGVGVVAVTCLTLIYRGRTEWQITARLPKPADGVALGDKVGSAGTAEADAVGISRNEAVLPPGSVDVPHHTADSHFAAPTDDKPAFSSSSHKLKRIFTTPVVYAIAFFMFLYVACEIAIGGWATSFLISDRGGNANAGYVTTGYYAGLTIGRVVLIPVTDKLGYINSVYVYTVVSLVLEIIIWFTRTLVGNAICFSLIGFVFGPVFPAALMVVADSLDEELRSGSMGFMGSVAGMGAALGPFIVGAISDKHGLWTLQPLMVAMMAAQLIVWAVIQRLQRKKPRLV